MDADSKYSINEEARCNEEFQCSLCGKWVTGFAALDPIIVDDVPICDYCGSDLTALRMAGEIYGVADKTKRLKS